MSKYIDADELMQRFGLDKATKYGNEDEEQQAFSYSTMMMYEIADMINDAPTVEVPQWITCSDKMPCGWCKKFDMPCDEVVNGKKNAQTKEVEQNEAK